MIFVFNFVFIFLPIGLAHLVNHTGDKMAMMYFCTFILVVVNCVYIATQKAELGILKIDDDFAEQKAKQNRVYSQSVSAVVMFLEDHPRYGDVAAKALVCMERNLQSQGSDCNPYDNLTQVSTILGQSLSEVDYRLLDDDEDEGDEDEEDCQCGHKP